MLRNLSSGEPACLTVTHLDSLILARCGFNHSADYRSVMAFGRARLVNEPDAKRHALTMMVDRFFPGRTARLRAMSPQEFRRPPSSPWRSSGHQPRIRAKVADDEEDCLLPIYAERLPIRTSSAMPSHARGSSPGWLAAMISPPIGLAGRSRKPSRRRICVPCCLLPNAYCLCLLPTASKSAGRVLETAPPAQAA